MLVFDKIKKFLFVMLALASLAVQAESGPVAMVTYLKGDVRIANSSQASVGMLSYLSAGEELILGGGAQVVITYFSESSEYSFKGPDHISIKGNFPSSPKGSAQGKKLNPDVAGAATNFVKSGKLAYATVEMRGLTMLKPVLVSPSNTKIATRTPILQWGVINDAESYELAITDAAGAVIQQLTTTGNTWQPANGELFQYGADYVWKITAHLKSGKELSGTTKFSVADTKTISLLESSRPAADAAVSDKVVYAMFLEESGFREEAKQTWKKLSDEFPADENLKKRAK